MNDPWGISNMTDDQVLQYLQEIQREQSILDAKRARAMAHLHALRQGIEGGKYAADEIAAVLSWSPFTAGTHLDTAVKLAERLPDTLAALETGQLDLVKARAIIDWTEPLTFEQARAVAAGVHEWSVGRTATALRQKLSREVHKIDPDGADARRRERVKSRQVTYFPDKDSMATLYIYDQ